jgi:predicted PurR-regulated permease PerM
VVILVFVGILAPVGALVAFVTQRLIVEGTELAHNLQTNGQLSIDQLASHFGPLRPAVERALSGLQPKLAAAAPQIVGSLGAIVAATSRAALRIGIGLFLLAVALYYFFLDGNRWRDRFVKLVPLPARDTRTFLDRFHRVSVAVVVGNLGTALAQALVATLGYFLFGATVPLIWGAATLFAALIPVVGPALVWLPVSLAVGVAHGWLHGVGLVIYGVLVIGTIDNVVRPLLTRRGLQLHPLLVFIAVFGGVMSFGVAGLFLGPLVVALVVAVLDVYERHLAVGSDR